VMYVEPTIFWIVIPHSTVEVRGGFGVKYRDREVISSETSINLKIKVFCVVMPLSTTGVQRCFAGSYRYKVILASETSANYHIHCFTIHKTFYIT
jgi:hypothetical protein